MERSTEQAARNEAIFRDANERIGDRRRRLDSVDGATPFVCECEEPGCTTILRLTLAEYEVVRAHPAQFVVAVGHPAREAETVHEGDGWTCVRKQGVSGAVARAEDARR